MGYCIYESKITYVGKEARNLLNEHNIMVMFGLEVPESLIDVCYIHDNNEVKEKIKIGDKIYFDNQEYKVVEIGNVANDNLESMGHCTFKFNKNPTEENILGGTIYLVGGDIPAINLGSTIKIFKNT